MDFDTMPMDATFHGQSLVLRRRLNATRRTRVSLADDVCEEMPR